MSISNAIQDLLTYAVRNGLADERDTVYLRNAYLQMFGVREWEPVAPTDPLPALEDILSALLSEAEARGLLGDGTTVEKDLFDTALMGVVTPRPSEVIDRFQALYAEDPKKATTWFYDLCRASDYVRTYRVKKDLKWVSPSKYGDLDITVNLSKPEKDPKAIAAAKLLPQSGYPKCALCHENEGFAGSLNQAPRQNLRQIPLTMGGDVWYLQYSPYVYYNEHCIVLSAAHTPMKITRDTFRRALDFVEYLPHYFVGSNADLPIVGGSILSHDHMQGGCYTFPMERAEVEEEVTLAGFPGITAGIVRWPLSVLRLQSDDKEELITAADKILTVWRYYTDEGAFVFAETDGEMHNTVTPIARMRDGRFELDLVLRNNITTEEHPLGVYHPHAKLHHIKKENIGLIEVMGLAVLPARLKAELEGLADAILKGRDIAEDPALSKHAEWLSELKEEYDFTPDNVNDILKREVGRVFEEVLEDAGVYKCTPEGREAFRRFLATVNE